MSDEQQAKALARHLGGVVTRNIADDAWIVEKTLGPWSCVFTVIELCEYSVKVQFRAHRLDKLKIAHGWAVAEDTLAALGNIEEYQKILRQVIDGRWREIDLEVR